MHVIQGLQWNKRIRCIQSLCSVNHLCKVQENGVFCKLFSLSVVSAVSKRTAVNEIWKWKLHTVHIYSKLDH